MFWHVTFAALWLFCEHSACLKSGEDGSCVNKNQNGDRNGVCVPITQCTWAISQARRFIKIDHCGFLGKTPIVCCPKDEVNRSNSSTSEPLTRTRTFGELSLAKCAEFKPNVFFAIGGSRAPPMEFRHMAALGYGSQDAIQWGCGGSLISRKHVLTAAHCLHSRTFGAVKFVRLGDLDLNSNEDLADPQDFNVLATIPHPGYNAKNSKNDVAILELSGEIKQTAFVRPACLHIGGPWDENWKITATGWGVTEFAGDPSSHLLEVDLKILDAFKCRQQYINNGEKGKINDKSQICAESADSLKIMDTCQGDSGGPLQVRNDSNFLIIGVTSFGKACGVSRSAGVYSRVSHYVPWIESTLWGNS